MIQYVKEVVDIGAGHLQQRQQRRGGRTLVPQATWHDEVEGGHIVAVLPGSTLLLPTSGAAGPSGGGGGVCGGGGGGAERGFDVWANRGASLLQQRRLRGGRGGAGVLHAVTLADGSLAGRVASAPSWRREERDDSCRLLVASLSLPHTHTLIG